LSLYNEYKSSLKVIEAEEYADLVVFRPLGFLVVKLVAGTGLTPNQLTIISMIFGIISGVLFAFGTAEMVFAGGIMFAVSAVFDCADGQLARLKSNGTSFGRLLDGLVDYTSTISAFIGIGLSGILIGETVFQWWALVIFTGISYAVQAGLVDFYKSEFMANAEGKADFAESELKAFTQEYDEVSQMGGKAVEKFMLRLYIYYTRMQIAGKKIHNAESVPNDLYMKFNRLPLVLWNLNGTATHGLFLVIFAIFNRLDLFIWYILVFGNLWSMLAWSVQKASEKRLKDFAAVPER